MQIEGLLVKDMNVSQRDVAKKLIDVYVTRLPESNAEAQRHKLTMTSLDTAAFAWRAASAGAKAITIACSVPPSWQNTTVPKTKPTTFMLSGVTSPTTLAMTF